ncbi:Rho-type GTPase activating protein Rga1 [Sorochytrium milnesiophthora]
MSGQFVRALGGTFHLDCFRCKDCNAIVAQKFFPVTDDTSGAVYPLCERDYFRRLDLLCHNCGQALRGSYIQALGQKYHVDHFTCSICPTVFGPSESYYEHDGNVYCHYHYSTLHATRCAGCQVAILKQFVEINRNGVDEQWHPECYMIDKNGGDMNAEQLKQNQRIMEEKVSRIWSVLSMFEESAAACISDMLLNVSNGFYVEGVNEAASFILHVEVLFAGIDEIESALRTHNDKTGLHHTKEPKMLCKKIVGFFSLLSHTQESGSRRLGITQELLSLVTSLAHLLKILIRIALSGALKLERTYHMPQAIYSFLNKLLELSEQDKSGGPNSASTTPATGSVLSPVTTASPGGTVPSMDRDGKIQVKVHPVVGTDVKSDLCQLCRHTIEEECYKFGSYRWHLACLKCSVCSTELANDTRRAYWSQAESAVFCVNCKPEGAVQGFQRVTLLEQYTFLLRVALKRLYSLLKVKGSANSAQATPSPTPSPVDRPLASAIAAAANADTRSKSFSNADRPPLDQLTSNIQKMTKPLVADHTLDDGVKVSDLSTQVKRRTLVEPTASPSVHNLIEAAQTGSDPKSLSGSSPALTSPTPARSVAPTNEYNGSADATKSSAGSLTNGNVDNAQSPLLPGLATQVPAPTAMNVGSGANGLSRSATVQASLSQSAPTSANGQRPSPSLPVPVPLLQGRTLSADAIPSIRQTHPQQASLSDNATTSAMAPSVGNSAASLATSHINLSHHHGGGSAGHFNMPLSSSPNDYSFPPNISPQDMSFTDRIRQRAYLSELSALEYFIVKNLAVCNMAPYLSDYISLDELLELIESKKVTLWSRFMSSLKGKNKPKSKGTREVLTGQTEGTFGVPIDVLLDRAGVSSNLGAGPGRMRIPRFVDSVITALRQSDLYVQGIFRLNGNIRRLNQLKDEIDKDPTRFDISEENSVQLAALLKKFLRELPEPLLTFKLHRLFVMVQKIGNDAHRKKLLHYICCLLPKTNRDVLEVLFLFLRDAAKCALPDDPDRGSKMDMQNLALVITPNILYSKTRDPLKDENSACIQGVFEMLLWQDEFWTVPEDIAAMLAEENLTESMTELNTKDILRKVENLVKLKKSHSSGGVYIVSSDDHTASNAQIEDS